MNDEPYPEVIDAVSMFQQDVALQEKERGIILDALEETYARTISSLEHMGMTSSGCGEGTHEGRDMLTEYWTLIGAEFTVTVGKLLTKGKEVNLWTGVFLSADDNTEEIATCTYEPTLLALDARPVVTFCGTVCATLQEDFPLAMHTALTKDDKG